MSRALCCQFCRVALDPAQEFAYHVEAQTVGNPTMLAAIRRLPYANGRPLRVCRECQFGIEQQRYEVRDVNYARRATVRSGQALLTVVAAVGVMAITAKLSRWLTDAA
jgi:hypothetical protein